MSRMSRRSSIGYWLENYLVEGGLYRIQEMKGDMMAAHDIASVHRLSQHSVN